MLFLQAVLLIPTILVIFTRLTGNSKATFTQKLLARIDLSYLLFTPTLKCESYSIIVVYKSGLHVQVNEYSISL